MMMALLKKLYGNEKLKLKKFLDPKIEIEATYVRVLLLIHSEAVNIELESEIPG